MTTNASLFQQLNVLWYPIRRCNYFFSVNFWSLCPFPIYFLTNRKICSLKLSPSFLNKVFQKYLEMNVLLIKEVLLSWSQKLILKTCIFYHHQNSLFFLFLQQKYCMNLACLSFSIVTPFKVKAKDRKQGSYYFSLFQDEMKRKKGS